MRINPLPTFGWLMLQEKTLLKDLPPLRKKIGTPAGAPMANAFSLNPRARAKTNFGPSTLEGAKLGRLLTLLPKPQEQFGAPMAKISHLSLLFIPNLRSSRSKSRMLPTRKKWMRSKPAPSRQKSLPSFSTGIGIAMLKINASTFLYCLMMPMLQRVLQNPRM